VLITWLVGKKIWMLFWKLREWVAVDKKNHLSNDIIIMTILDYTFRGIPVFWCIPLAKIVWAMMFRNVWYFRWNNGLSPRRKVWACLKSNIFIMGCSTICIYSSVCCQENTKRKRMKTWLAGRKNERSLCAIYTLLYTCMFSCLWNPFSRTKKNANFWHLLLLILHKLHHQLTRPMRRECEFMSKYHYKSIHLAKGRKSEWSGLLNQSNYSKVISLA